MGLILDHDHPFLDQYFPSIEDCARKLSNYLTSMEREHEYLLKQANNSADSNTYSTQTSQTSLPLPVMMQKVLEAMQMNDSCTVNIDSANTIFLRMFRVKKDPESIMLHQVPVPIKSSLNHETLKKDGSFWDDIGQLNESIDIGMKNLIPYIDGASYVKKIAFQADMDIDLVIKGLRHLLYYGYIGLVDIFQFSNRYTVMPGLQNLYSDPSLQLFCITSIIKDENIPKPSAQTIFKLYAMVNPELDVKQIMHIIQSMNINVDIHKMVTFGVLNKIIRRVHKYPLSIVQHENITMVQTLNQFIEAKNSLDEICVSLNMSSKEIEPYIDKYMYI